VLTFVGFLIVLILPARPGSAWKLDGPFPPRGRGRPRRPDTVAAQVSDADTTPPASGGAAEPPASEPPSTSGS
jgi:hypothetical protein